MLMKNQSAARPAADLKTRHFSLNVDTYSTLVGGAFPLNSLGFRLLENKSKLNWYLGATPDFSNLSLTYYKKTKIKCYLYHNFGLTIYNPITGETVSNYINESVVSKLNPTFASINTMWPNMFLLNQQELTLDGVWFPISIDVAYANLSPVNFVDTFYFMTKSVFDITLT